ncbi:biofilm regulator 1 [Lichtheimia ornata]|uniref:Biofilm regulator 1 n=1 Tax=Lichtheimia ornata TaxID=688661 RepID=A0AAD7V3T8_9FUNG|nr:biofilm regulator 1 [Lichtheimia ornata]KAJ8658300.1 biofilm regulator 1 [Lichtheimia ornata]
MDISDLCTSPTTEEHDSPHSQQQRQQQQQQQQLDNHSPHASPILSQHLPAPHTSSSSSSHDPFDSLNTSFSRYPSDIGGSRSTGTTQQQHPSTNNNPGSSPYARSSGMKDVIEQCEVLCNTLDMFRNRDPRARSKSDIDIVSQTAGRLLSSLLSLQGQTTSCAPSSPSTTTDINKEVTRRSSIPLFQVRQHHQDPALKHPSTSSSSSTTNTRRRAKRSMAGRRCHSCHTTETPEWRRGPDGARTLCNACGLHYAKLVRNGSLGHTQTTDQQQHLPQDSASQSQYSGFPPPPPPTLSNTSHHHHHRIPVASPFPSSNNNYAYGPRENDQHPPPCIPDEGSTRHQSSSSSSGSMTLHTMMDEEIGRRDQ